MQELTSAMVKEQAKLFGADLCGIASMDRFEGAPPQADPRFIFPRAKVCIMLAFRIPRGYFRGIEEGTLFSVYPSMGYGGINMVVSPLTLRWLSCWIEDFGWDTAEGSSRSLAFLSARSDSRMVRMLEAASGARAFVSNPWDEQGLENSHSVFHSAALEEK